MAWESSYVELNSPWNFGAMYKINDYFSLGTQYLYGSNYHLPDTLPLILADLNVGRKGACARAHEAQETTLHQLIKLTKASLKGS